MAAVRRGRERAATRLARWRTVPVRAPPQFVGQLDAATDRLSLPGPPPVGRRAGNPLGPAATPLGPVPGPSVGQTGRAPRTRGRRATVARPCSPGGGHRLAAITRTHRQERGPDTAWLGKRPPLLIVQLTMSIEIPPTPYLDLSTRSILPLSPTRPGPALPRRRDRKQIRGYPGDDAQMRAVFDLVKWAPTAMNSQPLRVVLVRTPEARAAPGHDGRGQPGQDRGRPAGRRPGGRPRLPRRMPRVFPVFPGAREAFTDDDQRAQAAGFNAALQAGYFLVGIRAAGLAAGPMAGFDADAISRRFFPDGRHQAMLVVNIGQPTDPPTARGSRGWTTTRSSRPRVEPCLTRGRCRTAPSSGRPRRRARRSRAPPRRARRSNRP